MQLRLVHLLRLRHWLLLLLLLRLLLVEVLVKLSKLRLGLGLRLLDRLARREKGVVPVHGLR